MEGGEQDEIDCSQDVQDSIKTDADNIELTPQTTCEIKAAEQDEKKCIKLVSYELEGIVYSIPRSVIEKYPNSVLAQCLIADTDEQPEVIPIKRDGLWFAYIIKYMLLGASLEGIELTLDQVKSIEEEADFYGLTVLVDYCQVIRERCIKPEHRIIHLIKTPYLLGVFNNVRKACVLIYFEVIRYLKLDDQVKKLAEVCADYNCPIYYVSNICDIKGYDGNGTLDKEKRFVVLWEPGRGYSLSASTDEKLDLLKHRTHQSSNSDPYLLGSKYNLYVFMVDLQRRLSQLSDLGQLVRRIHRELEIK